ncbi:MAG: hypothetical protein ACREQB_13445 [Candidatus Binataceae bacterium]
MGLVVRFAEFQQQPKKARHPRVSAPDAGPAYYCMRCNADSFKLYPSGLAQCASCGAVMRNIAIAGSDPTKLRK